MKKTVHKIRITSFILIAVEIILLTVFSVFYFGNFFNFKDITRVEYVVLGFSLLLILDCIFIWIIFVLFASARRKNELKAAQIIGADIQEAYNFGEIGLVVVDENNVIIWTNDLFQERRIDILDLNIIEWSPELRPLLESGDAYKTVNIVHRDRTYTVEYVKDAGLFIFKDISEYKDLLDNSQKVAPVIGLLSLDNYNEVAKASDDFNDFVIDVKTEILNYCRTFKVLLRKYKEDTYFMFFTFEMLNKMREEGFTILDKVRECGKGQLLPITISAGIAYNCTDFIKTYEVAEEALSVAMSRGGDQIVISNYGSDMEFIGGKTEVKEKRSRVKSRVLADSLMSLIKASKNVLVMGHSMMDLDAFGSCLGIKAICDSEFVKRDCKVIIDLKLTEPKTRSAMLSLMSKDELEDVMISPKAAYDSIDDSTLLILVDVHTASMTMAPNLLDKATKVVVIDHHRRTQDYIESPVLNYIDPSMSSTCEAITEFITFSSANPPITLDPTYATIMLAGIYLDTNYFRSKTTGVRAFGAASSLKDFGADVVKADDLLKDDFEEHELINEITHSLITPIPGIVYCVAKEENGLKYEGATLAKAANKCLTFKAVNASFVIGATGPNEYRMSARSDGSINVSLLMEKLGGGGHYAFAAGSFTNTTSKEIVSNLLKVLDEYLDQARDSANYKDDKDDREDK